MLYQSSKGAVEIDTMPLTYAGNALAKLRRSEPERIAEIEALQAHVDRLTADAEANPRAVVGGNNPPADDAKPEGREAIEAHVADLLAEVEGVAFGNAIEDQDQADAVGALHRQLQQAVTLVNDAATKEKAPHNDAISEIAGWQNGYTAKGLKKTPDGSLTKAITATGNLSAGWLRKQDDLRRERERELAAAAAKAAQEALAARAEARETTDLAVIDKAEDALAEAEMLIREAKGAAKEKVRTGVGDGVRAIGLRSVFTAHICEEADSWAKAYAFFKQRPEFRADFHALIQRYADQAARTEAARLAGVPGFVFVEDRVAA